MDLKQVVMLALQVSIIATVFGFGLKATAADVLYLVHRPGLLARSLLAMFVVMPIVAVVLVWAFDFPPAVNIALMVLAISPVPPLLPMKETKAGGNLSYGLGLMAMLALLSIVVVPATLTVLGRVVGRPLGMAPGSVAGVMFKAILVPLAVGILIHAVSPGVAERLAKIVMLAVKVLLPVVVVAVLASALAAIYALISGGTVVALAIFTIAGLAVGHVLGAPDPDHSTVLALSTACRHPAIAFAIATTNFPEHHFAALILLYLIVSAIVGVPYLLWQQRRGSDLGQTPSLRSSQLGH